MPMLSLDDERWNGLQGGYRSEFDPRLLFSKLESGKDVQAVWHELWEELHHQGDEGEASYAAVPHLVRIHRQRSGPDWNTYALVAIIELAPTRKGNPALLVWLEKDYRQAIQELAEIGLAEFDRAEDPQEIRAILSLLAISKRARIHGKSLLNYSEQELLEFDLPLDLEC